MSRKIDALVAEHVMGLPVREGPDPYVHAGTLRPMSSNRWWLKGTAHGCHYDWATVPAYSTDIAAAWAVVEKFETVTLYKVGNIYDCGIDAEHPPDWPIVGTDQDSLPLAICLEALKAKGINKP